jgi:SAM-dependent methyltransferase
MNSIKSPCPFCSKDCDALFKMKDLKTNFRKDFTVFKCKNCFIEFINPPSNLEKFYEENYFTDFNSNNSFMFNFKKYIIEGYYLNPNLISKLTGYFFINYIAAMPSRLKKGDKILDFGCGPGDVLFLLKNVGAEVFGLDISDHAVKIANNKGLENVKVGTEKELNNYENETFMYIRASHVLEHMIDPIGFINISQNKLKKGGSLLIQTPNIDSLGKIFGVNAKYYSDIPRHIILFSSKSLIKIFKDRGFEDVNIHYKVLFSDFRDNLVLYLNKKIPGFNNSKGNKILNSIIANFIFLPLDIIASFLGKGQTITIEAVK